MAFADFTHSGSASPSSIHSHSPNLSPSSDSRSLSPAPRTNEERRQTPASKGARGSARRAIDRPRGTAGTGGCWTCRLRRKKCDEEPEEGQCKTCKRLGIECLGWGSKRPDWMRDKQAVEEYKANIKAQLTRAGLIRGQPRGPRPDGDDRPSRTSRHRLSNTSGHSPSSSATSEEFGLPNMPGASQFAFSDPTVNVLDVNSLDLGTSFFSTYDTNPVGAMGPNLPMADFDFPPVADDVGFNFDVHAPSPVQQSIPLYSGQSALQEEHVLYYFQHVRTMKYFFSSDTAASITYSLIMQDPQSAVTHAVCALASLHYTQMRVAQGLEAPDANAVHTNTRFFQEECHFQLASAKQMRGHNESDAIAALHLVSYAQMSGGAVDWQPLLVIACDWLQQTGLPKDENPKLQYRDMSPAAKLAVRATLLMDVFSSMSLGRAPRFMPLFQRLTSKTSAPGYWAGQVQGAEADGRSTGLGCDGLNGCPDDAVYGLGEVSALAQWKATEQARGSLSLRELMRKGDDIERRLRSHFTDAPSPEDTLQDAQLAQLMAHTPVASIPTFPDDDTRRLIANIFRESTLLYLHTVLSGSHPAVNEIVSTVNRMIQLLHQLPASLYDRLLIFPIFLTGCLCADATQRNFLKTRLQAQSEASGLVDMASIVVMMETVWHERDINKRPIDWQQVVRDSRLKVLLL
ncbi:fungal-specific transcription factor domain-containing protein [Schizophyllum commune]